MDLTDPLPVPTDPAAAETAKWKRVARAMVCGWDTPQAEPIGKTAWSISNLGEFCHHLHHICAGRQREMYGDPYPPGHKRSDAAGLKRAWRRDGWTDLDRAAARMMAAHLGVELPASMAPPPPPRAP